jgi:monomeric sarcosine oxidase
MNTAATRNRYDVAVIGAGVFGAWTAHELRRAGASVILLDAYGPAHARASSGGESRIIRMGYGADDVYTRWSSRSLPRWQQLFARVTRPELFHRTGVLWIANFGNTYATDSLVAMQQHNIAAEKLSLLDLRHRYPQIVFEEDAWGILEPDSGVLLARRAVAAVVEEFVKLGGEYRTAAVEPPAVSASLDSITTSDRHIISAGSYVFACGSWLGKIFPEILGARIFPSRQEIFFFGTPSGSTQFNEAHLPTWLYLADEFYGMPDIESRGFKVANDRHGERVDPDTQSRIASPAAADAARAFVARRFPALAGAPIVETRVCQYENTSNGDFLIDKHPAAENVWLVGGGSGHGFKHGPAMGEYVAAHVLGRLTPETQLEPRFSLATKQATQNRSVH